MNKSVAVWVAAAACGYFLGAYVEGTRCAHAEGVVYEQVIRPCTMEDPCGYCPQPMDDEDCQTDGYAWRACETDTECEMSDVCAYDATAGECIDEEELR